MTALLLLSIVFASLTSYSISDTDFDSWEQEYSYEQKDYFSDVCRAAIGGVLVCGRSLSSQTAPSIRVLRLDNDGNNIWRNWTYPGGLEARSCLRHPDGSFIVVGTADDLLVLKILDNSTGTIENSYEDIYWACAYDVITTAEADIVVAGMTLAYYQPCFYVRKLTSELEEQSGVTWNWIGPLPEHGSEYATCICELNEPQPRRLVVGGYNTYFGARICLLSHDGNLLGGQMITLPGEKVTDIVALPASTPGESKIAVLLSYPENYSKYAELRIYCIDSSNNFALQETYLIGPDECETYRAHSIIPAAFGSWLISGVAQWSNSPNARSSGPSILLLDSSFNVLSEYSQSYTGANSFSSYEDCSIVTILNGLYLDCMYVSSRCYPDVASGFQLADSQNDEWNGYVWLEPAIIQQGTGIQPRFSHESEVIAESAVDWSSGTLTVTGGLLGSPRINLTAEETGIASVVIFDISGRMVYRTSLEITENSTIQQIEINSSIVNSLSNGTYLCVCSIGNVNYTAKFILLK